MIRDSMNFPTEPGQPYVRPPDIGLVNFADLADNSAPSAFRPGAGYTVCHAPVDRDPPR